MASNWGSDATHVAKTPVETPPPFWPKKQGEGGRNPEGKRAREGDSLFQSMITHKSQPHSWTTHVWDKPKAYSKCLENENGITRLREGEREMMKDDKKKKKPLPFELKDLNIY